MSQSMMADSAKRAESSMCSAASMNLESLDEKVERNDKDQITRFVSKDHVKPLHKRHSQNIGMRVNAGRDEKERVSVSLGRPACDGNLAVCGTDDFNGEQNMLFLLDTSAIMRSAKSKSLIDQLSLSAYVRDVAFLTGSKLLVATGAGTVQIVAITEKAKLAVVAGTEFKAHDMPIREMAFNHTNHAQVATGGFDKQLKLLDCSVGPKSVMAVNVGEVVGSVRWSSWNPSTISFTTDLGKFGICDFRENALKPRSPLQNNKGDLYTHSAYSQYDVLLGFGDGEIHHVDIRVPSRPVALVVQDPYVECIGDIQYSHSAGAFLVSGVSDYSVWKHDKSCQEARVWSHMTSGDSANSTNVVTNAVWLDDTTVFATNSFGCVELATQSF